MCYGNGFKKTTHTRTHTYTHTSRKSQQWQNHAVVVSFPGFGKQNIVQCH